MFHIVDFISCQVNAVFGYRVANSNTLEAIYNELTVEESAM